MVHFTTVHSIVAYGIIFWGISTYSKIIFKIQKRIIRTIMHVGNKDSCRNIFKKLHILQTQYIFSTLFVAKNKDLFKTISEVHSFNSRFQYYLHIPTANLTVYQKGVWYSGARIYNHLPPALKQLSDDTLKFKAALKRFLLTNSFYTMEEYYNWKQ
jgi:hypothetical protein